MAQQPDPWLAALDAVQRPSDSDPWLSALDEAQAGAPADERSVFSRAYDAVFTAPQFVTDAARWVANRIDDPALRERPLVVQKEGVPIQVPANPIAPAFVAGATEGASSLLTPGDALLTALNLRALKPVLKGVRHAPEAVSALNRAAGLATAVRGGERLIDAESLPEGGAGTAQLALGTLATMAGAPAPRPTPRPRGSLPPGAQYVVTPDGRVVAAGSDVPMVQASDGSFVRGVPAEYARREVRGALPPARTPIVTPPPAGSVQPDPSFVRGVPARPARREPRGLLPGGRTRFVAGEHGAAVPVEKADEWLSALDRVQGRPPAESAVRGQRAAVVEREIDPTKITHEAIKVRQYSSDPNAADTPLLSDDDLRVLRVMRDDLQEFTPQQGRKVPLEGESVAGLYVPGTRGSGVADDVRTISGLHVSNQKVAQAVDDLLAGKTPSNKLHVAVLDAIQGYREGRGGYKGTTLPMETADAGASRGRAVPDLEQELARRSAAPSLSKAAKIAEVDQGVIQLEELLERTGGAGARTVQGRGTFPVSKPKPGGGASAAVDDFDQFSAAFDEIADTPGGREPGESGFITSQLATHVGGAVAGGAAGTAAGDEDDSTLRQGLKIGAGIVAGAAAPALFRRPGAASAVGRVAAGPATVIEMPAAGARPPRAGRQGEPIDEPLKGFEPFLAKFSNPLVREGITTRIAENNGFAQQRRGVVGNKALGQFANEVRVNVSKALPKGTALNAESITAYARAMQETQRKVNELADLVKLGKATDGDVLALAAARAEADVVAKSLIGARAEAGRALGAFNFYRSILDTGNVELFREALKAPGLREEAEKIAKGLAALPNDPLTRYRWLQNQGSSTLMGKVRSYYYANILSGVKTHERNLIGNVANIATNMVTHPVAAGIDVLKSAATGAPRQVRFDEMPSQVAGALAGLERGVRDFAFTMRHGISPDALSRTVNAGELGKLDVPRVEFAGGGLNPFNIPGRLLDASDTLFRSVARNGELYGLAHAQAKREGLTGQRFDDRVAELRSGLTADAAALRQQADAFATRTVFQEKPGPFASWLQLGAQKFPALSFVVPFIKTPANIMRQGLEFSPAGAVMKPARQGGRAGTQAQARVALGTAAAGTLAYLAATGRLSGDGPRDPARRAALMESGWRPNSVKVGDQWVAYSLFQPVSVQAAIVANAYEGWQEKGAKAESAADVASATVFRSINSFISQSFLSGLFDFVEAVSDPDRSASRVIARTASGMIPLTGLVRTVQQGKDPVVRQPEGVVESVKAGIPGLSEQVPARIDRFGEPVVREGGAVRRAADPFNVSTEKDDPIARELERLGVRLALPSDELKLPEGMTLTRQEETALKQAKGRAIRQRLEKLMTSQGYSRVPDTVKVKWVERVKHQVAQAESKAARKRVTARQSTPRIPTGPGERMFTGRTLGRRQVEALAREFGTSYAEARSAVIERGGQVQDK